MLRCAVKFCGGCNPRYDRGKAYQTILDTLKGSVEFTYPKEGEHYDALLIIRGCTGCQYLYDDITASRRIVLADSAQLDSALSDIQNICRDMAEEACKQ